MKALEAAGPSSQTSRIHPLASFRFALLLYGVIFLIGFWAVIVQGRVIIADRQGIEFGLSDPKGTHLENRKFNDDIKGYIPDAAVILNGKRSTWITTWNPYNELGRPVFHQSILSPTFLPTLPFTWIVKDPSRLVTAVALLASFLAGLFALLFAREFGLGPWPSLFAAITLGTGHTLIYWATFPMFASTYAWALALYWAMTVFSRKGDLASWSFLVFAIYALLSTGYPQMVIYHLYLGAGLVIYAARQQIKLRGWRHYGARRLFPMAAGAVLGIALALPTMLDTFVAAMASARLRPDISFFRAVLPDVSSAGSIATQLALWAFPQAYGNPSSADFIALYGGLSLTPVALFFVLAPDVRRTWGWWLCIGVLSLLIGSGTVFAFAVSHLGMNISRTTPIAIAVIPLTMIAATQLDTLLKAKGRAGQQGRRWRWLLAGALYLATLMVAFAIHPVMPARTLMIAGYAAILLTCLVAAERTRPELVILASVVWLGVVDRDMLLTQAKSDVVLSSPFVHALMEQTEDGSRYAMLEPLSVLPPNLNAQVGLASLHSYNSLSPRSYHAFVQRLGGESSVYGRESSSISATALATTEFKLANIGALVAAHPLSSNGLVLAGTYDGLWVYGVKERWGRFMRLDLPVMDVANNAVEIDSSDQVEPNAASAILDRGDFLKIKLNQAWDRPSLLVVSQSFNDAWRAATKDSGHTVRLHTLRVNDALQGIIVPPRVQTLELSFKPAARFAWVSLVALVLLMTINLASWWRNLDCGRLHHPT